jgi:hypothetical protein
MLRKWLFGIAAASLVLGLVLLATVGFQAGFALLCWAAVLAVALLIERFRYKPIAREQPGPGWKRTAERFVDEDNGQLVTVYIRPETGERMYVRE